MVNTERAVETVAVFILIFLITLAIGRLLKRRAGVPFGIFFQLFALTLSCYTAARVYGLESHWRNDLGAILILLSTTILVAFIDRYIWNAYFEQRGIAVPKLLRDLVATLIFLIALMIVLSVGYHAETQLKGLLAGSGVLAIILGFAAQNLLSSVIAGLSLQIQRPYKVGDWLKMGDTYGEVMEIRWGATRLRTNDAITLHIPNNEMVKQTIVNLSYPNPQPLHAFAHRRGVWRAAQPRQGGAAPRHDSGTGGGKKSPAAGFPERVRRVGHHLPDQVHDVDAQWLFRNARRHLHQHLVQIPPAQDHHPVPAFEPSRSTVANEHAAAGAPATKAILRG